MDPRLDGTLRAIADRYCLTSRLWVLSFYNILEALRKASFSSMFAFDLLQDRLREAYDFYNDLLQDATLLPFKSSWCEALGDLSKFRGVVVAMRVAGTGPTGSACHSNLVTNMEAMRWGEMAEEWYLAGLRENPGRGKLHHLVGLLFRQHEQGFGALRALFHLSKRSVFPCIIRTVMRVDRQLNLVGYSTIVQHPFQTSHETMSQFWSPIMQERRRMWMHCAKFKATDIFLFLQGLLFRRDFGDFNTALSCFIERLKAGGVEEEEWAMMAAISISSMLDFGRSNPICLDDQSLDDTSPTQQSGNRRKRVDLSAGRNGVQCYAIQLTCCTLSIAIQQQLQPSSLRQNPYIPLILTFLSTVQPQPTHLSQYISWEQLDVFLSACASRYAHFSPESSLYTPFEENYYLRGMQWAEDTFDADPNEDLSNVRGFEVSWGVIRRALFPEERAPRPHTVKVGARLKSLG